MSVSVRHLEDYLQEPKEEESLPYYSISNDDDFLVLPLLILSSYLRGTPEFSIKFNKVPTVAQFDRISDVISQLPGLEITYITIKEVFIKYIASYEELDLSKIDQSWIKLLLDTSEFVFQNFYTNKNEKTKSYYLQYCKRAEKLFLKKNLKDNNKLFVKLILENILKIINDVWNSSEAKKKNN
ncbi:MAG: hypothetical protein ACTSRG_07455 [Candidatus Helarchaeota archaeon]